MIYLTDGPHNAQKVDGPGPPGRQIVGEQKTDAEFKHGEPMFCIETYVPAKIPGIVPGSYGKII